MIEITIPGKPIAKARPRFYRRGNHVGTYNSQETEEGRFLMMAMRQLQGTNGPIESGVPIRLSCEFIMPIPKSTSKKKSKQMIDGEIKHTKKPDLDNLIKFTKDCLNGLAWHDDSQVVEYGVMKKIYGDEPMTRILIEVAND